MLGGGSVGIKRLLLMAHLFKHKSPGVRHLLQPGRKQRAPLECVKCPQRKAEIPVLSGRNGKMKQGLIGKYAVQADFRQHGSRLCLVAGFQLELANREQGAIPECLSLGSVVSVRLPVEGLRKLLRQNGQTVDCRCPLTIGDLSNGPIVTKIGSPEVVVRHLGEPF